MELHNIAILAQKMKNKYVQFDNPQQIYKEIKNSFIKFLIKEKKITGTNLFDLIMMIHLLNQKKSINSIVKLLENFRFGFKIIVITESDPMVDCGQCSGDGVIDCDVCNGSRSVRCYSCAGEGEITCQTCDGEREVECYYCDGSGVSEDDEICPTCRGDGHVNCYECSVSGTETCQTCDGDGDLICDSCNGNGTMECETCDGDGEVEASGKYKVDIYSFLSVNTKLKDILIDFEGKKISKNLFNMIKNDKLSINNNYYFDHIVSIRNYENDYDVDDILIEVLDENPIISLGSNNNLIF